MSNQYELKRQTLAEMLAANRLTKVAGDQEIKHTTPLAQDNLGKEQTQEIEENIEGVIASTPEAKNTDTKKVDTPPNCQNLNTPADAALSATGTKVNEMEQNDPLTNVKTAADYRRTLAGIMKQLEKKASAQPQQKQASQQVTQITTAREVMDKVASLTTKSTQQDLQDAKSYMMKLAETNPLFNVCRERILMRKMAEDIDALAAAEEISPDEAAALLDAAAADDPTMMEAAAAEADGEALGELADAEDTMADVQALADGASAATGKEISPEVVLDAMDTIQEEADRLGVPPEAIIQAVVEDMTVGGDITPEDEAKADELMAAAAEMGASPEEVLQAATAMLGEGEGEAAPAEDPEATAIKEAASRPGMTSRAAYASHLIHKVIG